jgi:hypothetical protein
VLNFCSSERGKKKKRKKEKNTSVDWSESHQLAASGLLGVLCAIKS